MTRFRQPGSSAPGAAVENETAAVYQLNHAERLAETADPREAFPFRRARVWTVTAALFAVAIGLFWLGIWSLANST